MITSERCEDIGSWLSENAQKETPEYTSTMAVRLYALTHSFSRRFGPRAPLNVAICRAALRWVAIRRDASRSDALCTGLRLRLRMAIRRYVAIRRDMWRCHALCVPYVSSTSLPEDYTKNPKVRAVNGPRNTSQLRREGCGETGPLPTAAQRVTEGRGHMRVHHMRRREDVHIR